MASERTASTKRHFCKGELVALIAGVVCLIVFPGLVGDVWTNAGPIYGLSTIGLGVAIPIVLLLFLCSPDPEA